MKLVIDWQEIYGPLIFDGKEGSSDCGMKSIELPEKEALEMLNIQKRFFDLTDKLRKM